LVERERPLFSKAEGKESNEYAFFAREFELEQIATSSRALERARISFFFKKFFFGFVLCRRIEVRSDALGRRFLDKAIALCGENKKPFFGFIKRKNRSSRRRRWWW